MFDAGFYGVFFLDHGQADQHYFPVFAFLFMVFTFQLGLRSLPSLLLSELFSYRSMQIHTIFRIVTDVKALGLVLQSPYRAFRIPFSLKYSTHWKRL